MTRFIHIVNDKSLTIRITRYTSKGVCTRPYHPKQKSQARITRIIQGAHSLVEIKNNTVYVTIGR